MKQLSRLFIVAVLCLPLALSAQLSAVYQFTTGVDNTQWYTLTPDSTVLKVGTGNDSYASPVTDIGFTFNFAGVDYTQFSVNSDGTVRLGSTAVTASYYNTPFSSSYANYNNPKICGLGCDGYLVAATSASPADYIAYQVFGSAGEHVLVIEISTGTYATATRNNHYTFQVQLAETDNSMTLMYSPTAPAAGPSVAYQLGACTSANDVVLFNVATNTMSVYNNAGTNDNNAAGTWPDAGRYYTLTPSPDPCYPVTMLTASNITADSVTLTWSDTNNNNATYTVYNGDVEIASILSDTTYTVTGLNANTSYVFYVVSNCTSTNMSNAAGITVHTACSTISLPWTCGFEEDELMSTTQATALPWCSQRYVSAGTLGFYFPYGYNSSTYAHNGNRSLYFFGTTNANYPDTTVFIMPEVDVASYPMSGNRLNFWARMGAASNSKDIYVGTMTDPSDISTFTLVESVTVSGSTHTLFSVPLTNATGAYVAMLVLKGTGNLYIDDVTIEEVPSCVDVSNLTVVSVTSNSVTLSWDDTQNPAGTLYTAYNMADTSSCSDTITGNVAVIGNLNANTLYTFGVQANCPFGDAPFATVSVLTDCESFASPYTWTFEEMNASATPVCWEKVGDGTVNVMNSTANSHNGTQYVRFGGSGGNLIALPETQSEISTLQLRFWTRPESFSTASCGTFSVGYLTDLTDASSFVEVANYVYSDFSAYEEKTVTFAGAPAGSHMAMRHNSNSFSWYWFIDDVTIEDGPDCMPVSSLTASNITTNSATLTWGGNSTGYNIYNMSDNSLVASVSTTSYNLTGLTAMTNYTYGVTAICDTSESSLVTVNFTTECATLTLPYTETFETTSSTLSCWTVEGNGNWTFGVGDYSASTGSFQGSQNAKITHGTTGDVTKFISPAFDGAQAGMILDFAYVMRSWGSDIDELRVYIRAAADSAWQQVAEYTVAASTWTTESILIPGTVYQVAFEYTDNYGYGLGIDSVVFTGLPSDYCFAVSNLVASDATISGVTLSWSDLYNSGATYTIYDMASNLIIDTYITDTSYTITGLTSMTGYTLGVAANCSATNESNVVTVNTATLCAGGTCNVTIVGYDSYGDGWNGNAINIVQNGITVGTFTLANDSLLTETFAICDEAAVSFSWVAGSFPAETSFELFDGTNASVYTGSGSSMTDGMVFFSLENPCSGPDTTPVIQYTVTLNTADSTMGSVSPAGATTVDAGVSFTATATANAGYLFSAWTDGSTQVSTANPYTFTVTGDITLTAVFESEPVVCEAPTDLQETGVIVDKAIGFLSVKWTDNAGASQWNLQYRRQGTEQWTTVVVTGTVLGTPMYDSFTGLEGGEYYEIRVQAICDNGTVSEWSDILVAIAQSVGIDSWLENSVSLYPNPAEEYVDILVDGDLAVTAMEVYDIYGKVIRTVVGANNYSPLPTRINVSGLADGMYFVRVRTEKGAVTKTFVKR